MRTWTIHNGIVFAVINLFRFHCTLYGRRRRHRHRISSHCHRFDSFTYESLFSFFLLVSNSKMMRLRTIKTVYRIKPFTQHAQSRFHLISSYTSTLTHSSIHITIVLLHRDSMHEISTLNTRNNSVVICETNDDVGSDDEEEGVEKKWRMLTRTRRKIEEANIYWVPVRLPARSIAL